MTREEKEKAIDALKISAPVMSVTQKEFNDYIQTLNQVMDWLEQQPVLDKIRAEIELEKLGYPPSAGYYKAIMKCLQIIDKYKAESEGEKCK
jgi:hypothetical protein